MGQTATKSHRLEVLTKKFNHLSFSRQDVALDFISYLEEREEWKATEEVMADKEFYQGIQEGLKELARGEMEAIEL